jgi:Flp pilus assembly protein TadD
MRRTRALAVALAVVTLAVWLPATQLGFINYDDPEYVLDNPFVRAGLTWSSVVWAFTHVHSATWHPLTGLSHMLDVTWFGINPAGHHATSVVLHVLTTLVLFATLVRLTGAPGRSVVVAGLFALHPLRVESVAWVSERKDVLCGVWWMAACWAYVGWARAGGAGRYAAVVATTALALLAKPMAVTLPFALLLLDWWPLERLRSSDVLARVREKAPLFVLALAAAVVTYRAQDDAGAVVSLATVPLASRVANACVAYVAYVRQTLWPSDLAVFYPFHPVAAWQALAAAGLLVGVTAGAWWQRARRPYLVVGWLWWVGTLVPVIGLVKQGDQAMADRFTYLPSIGLALAAVWGVAEILAQKPRVRTALAVAALVACALVTRAQLWVWRSSIALFAHALVVTRDNALAHLNLGQALETDGRRDEALVHHREAVRLDPRNPRALVNLGQALAARDDRASARTLYATALELAPGHAMAHLNAGLLEAAERQWDAAAAHYEAALAIEPGYRKARIGLAIARREQGRFDDAIAVLQAVLREDPHDAIARNNLAVTLEAAGRREEAVAVYQASLRETPGDPRVHFNLAAVLLVLGRRDEALAHLREAVRLDPRDASLRDALQRVEEAARAAGEG